MQHNLAERAKRAKVDRLQLRKRTEAHLSEMVGSREYLVTRYGPETANASQINRLTATLEEIAKKVTDLMHPASKSRAPVPQRTKSAADKPRPVPVMLEQSR